jgi:hypothetical protein
MNLMGLGIAGGARQAARIPALVAGTEFAESTTPAAVRAAQIADLTRASETARAVDQAAKTIPRLLVPEITRGSAESAGIALQTISDPNATAEEKLKASYEALIGTLFAAGLGAEVARSLGVRGKNVTEVDILNDLASKKKTVGEAIGQVSGLLDQMERIVPVENLKTQFRKYVNELNPDEPFVYSKEPVGEGPRSRSRFVPDEERVALEKENAFVEQQKKSQEAAQQAALERSAAASGTPLKTVAEIFEDRNRPPVMERRASVTPEEATAVRRGTVTPEPTVIKAEAPTPTEGTPLRSVEDLLAERLRTRDERIAVEAESARPETLTTAEGVQAQRASERQALRERSAAIRKVLGRREFTAEELMRGEPTPEVPAEPVRSGEIITPELTVERPAPREGGMLPAREPEGTPLRSVDDILAERLKARDERLATEGKFRQKAEGVAQKLESLRTEVEAGLGANPFPQLMGAAWNGALSVAQAVIRAGGSVADGVAAGIRYARQNFKGKFDDAEFGSQLSRLIERPSPVQVPTGMQPRRFAERVAAAPGVPPVIREAVAASPEASYKRQNLEQTRQEAAAKTTGELNADIVDPESNVRIASAVELMNRQLAAGGISDVVDTTLKTAKKLTTFGQLINQAKLLNSTTREGITYLVTKSMAERGRTPDGPQLKKLGDMMDVYRTTSDAVKNAKLKLKEAADAGDQNAQITAARDLDLANTLKESADVDLITQISKMNPSTLPELYLALVQGSVQNTISLVGNLAGSVTSMLVSEPAKMLAYGIDQNLFGGKLGNTYGLKARTATRLNSLRRSLPEGLKILQKGSEYNPYEAGSDTGTPLNFTRAARNVYDGLFNGAKDVPILRNSFEATLGIYPDVIFRINQFVDNVFKTAERSALIEEMGIKRGLSNDQIKAAQRDPNLYLIGDNAFKKGAKGFTADDIGLIEFESARSVFQQNNVATEGVAGFNRFVQNKARPLYVPIRILSLFQKTPINVAAEILSFSPVGIFRDWKNLTPKERNLAASKLLIGSMVIASWNQLYDKGIITPNLDTPGETNKARELAKSGGVMPPGTLNTSGLYRYLKGQDPRFQAGDDVKDLAKYGTAGALGMMVGTARRLQERSRTNEIDWLVTGGAIAFSAANFVVKQGFLDGISGFIKALSNESGSALESITKKFLSTATSPLQPGILGSLMRAQREFVPVTTGDTVIKSFANELNEKYAALPFVDGKQLPLKRDLWGEAVLQTPKGSNPWLFNFLNSWKSREIEADPLNASIYQVWRKTADNRVIPSIPNPQITYGKTTFEKLNPEQFDRYAQLVGFWRRKNAEVVFGSKSYIQGSDDLRVQLLNKAYDRGMAIGKYRFIQELKKSGQSLTPMAPRRGFDE